MKYLFIIFILLISLLSGVYLADKLSYLILPKIYAGIHLVPDTTLTLQLRAYILSAYAGGFSSFIFIFFLWVSKNKCKNIIWVVLCVIAIPFIKDMLNVFLEHGHQNTIDLIQAYTLHLTGWFIFFSSFFFVYLLFKAIITKK